MYTFTLCCAWGGVRSTVPVGDGVVSLCQQFDAVRRWLFVEIVVLLWFYPVFKLWVGGWVTPIFSCRFRLARWSFCALRNISPPKRTGGVYIPYRCSMCKLVHHHSQIGHAQVLLTLFPALVLYTRFGIMPFLHWTFYGVRMCLYLATPLSVYTFA